jgi:hypothetical protein
MNLNVLGKDVFTSAPENRNASLLAGETFVKRF